MTGRSSVHCWLTCTFKVTHTYIPIKLVQLFWMWDIANMQVTARLHIVICIQEFITLRDKA